MCGLSWPAQGSWRLSNVQATGAPFAGRIGGAAYEFRGRRFELEPNDGLGNAIHGFVYNRPWRVVEQSALRVVGEFQASKVDRKIL